MVDVGRSASRVRGHRPLRAAVAENVQRWAACAGATARPSRAPQWDVLWGSKLDAAASRVVRLHPPLHLNRIEPEVSWRDPDRG